MDLSLQGKVALVTGGGRGLGRSIVRGLTQAGAHVVVTAAREIEEIERIASEAPKGAVAAILADVTKEEDCARVVEETLKRFGKLDVLINNAGRGMKYVNESFLTQPTRFWETDPDTWRMVIDTNVNGPFLMARASAPHMLKAGWGRIINMSMAYATMRQKRLFSLRPVESGVGIGNSDLGARAGRHGRHRQCRLAGRSDADRYDPRIHSTRRNAAACSIRTSSSPWLCGSQARPPRASREAAKLCARDAGVYEAGS